MKRANIRQAQSDRRKFDVEERVVDVLGRFGCEKTNAARSSHNKACAGDGHGWCSNRRQRGAPPEPQQTEVNHENGAEERSNAQDVYEINDTVSPHTGLAHGVAQEGTLQPRHEFVQTELSGEALLAVGINVEGAPVPDYPFRLDLITLWIAIAMAVDGYHRAHRNNAFFQAGIGRTCGRRKCEIPHVAISAYLHRCMWASQADRALDSSRNLKFFVEIPCPTVMSQNRNRPERKCQHDNACINGESRFHSYASFSRGASLEWFTAYLFTSARATLLIPLSAIARFPSFIAIMFRTTPPPDGISQVWNFSVLGSNRTSVFGFTPDSLYQMMSLYVVMP